MEPEVYEKPESLPPAARGGCWLIGNFDGVHLGHQAIIRQLSAEYPHLGLITFEPHPVEFFRPGPPFLRLTPWPLRCRLLAQAGICRIRLCRFDAAFAALSAGQFISEVLEGQCGAELVAVGADFRFGSSRTGDVALLQARLGAGRVRVLPLVCDGQGQPYSSSRIRAALTSGDLAAAERLAGWPIGQKGAI